MKEKQIEVHSPATADKAVQFSRNLRLVRYWRDWYHANGEPSNWNFLTRDPVDPKKQTPVIPINEQSLQALEKIGMTLYDDLCQMGRRKTANGILRRFREEGR